MQPSIPNRPLGSFAKPPEPARQAEQAQQAPAATQPAPPHMPQVPVAEEKPEVQAEKERQEKINEFKKTFEKELEVELTSDDVTTYLFKGILAKEVSIIPGKMKGVFTTLRIKEIQEIDMKMAKLRDEAKHTAQGIANEEALVTLSYAWTHASGRPLGATPDEREKKIRDMGSLFIQAASDARVKFDTLLKLALNDGATVKK